MNISEDKLTLENLREGQAVELFDIELQKVLENIADKDTAEGVRKINLVVKFKPDSDRAVTKIEIECKSTLAPNAGLITTAIIEQDIHGKFELNEFVQPKQQELGFSDRKNPAEDHENVTDINDKKESKAL